jgi:hypothetical protein
MNVRMLCTVPHRRTQGEYDILSPCPEGTTARPVRNSTGPNSPTFASVFPPCPGTNWRCSTEPHTTHVGMKYVFRPRGRLRTCAGVEAVEKECVMFLRTAQRLNGNNFPSNLFYSIPANGPIRSEWVLTCSTRVLMPIRLPGEC